MKPTIIVGLPRAGMGIASMMMVNMGITPYIGKFDGKSLNKIPAKQFIVGTIPYKPEFGNHVEDYNRIFILRHLRDLLISNVQANTTPASNLKWITRASRYLRTLPMGETRVELWMKLFGGHVADQIKSIIPWIENQQFLYVEYEQMRDQPTMTWKRVADYLGVPAPDGQIIDYPSDYTQFWSTKAERAFSRLGYHQIHDRISLITKQIRLL